VQLVNQGYLSYAEAVLLGRQGRRAEAESAFTRGDAAMRDMPWYRNQARRIVAEAAIRDGWGDPVAWLREAIPFFQGQGQERMTSACRSLLRKAGAPAPRKGRGESDVPTDLRARGVTSREMDVLLLLAKGLSNREIAAQLFLSPRTVERHVENLTTKLDIQGRSQLIAFAASRAAASPTG
jgi:DNA-binding NarL/FixJ family response regulator